MNILRKYIALSLLFTGAALTLGSCSQDEPADSPFVDSSPVEIYDSEDYDGEYESTILVYAIASNNLFGNLAGRGGDKEEMVKAAQQMDLKKNNILVLQAAYELDPTDGKYDTQIPSVTLQKLVKKGEEYRWKEENYYPADIAPLDPSRIREVIDYVFSSYPADTQGMIFWSHSSGSEPYLTGRSAEVDNVPMQYSFGWDDFHKNEKYYKLNIDELSAAMPDHLLDFIWFDSCYMGNIESMYELRNKCDYYVGYATEVWSPGMPYHYVIPLIARSNPDLVGGAKEFFRYYNEEYNLRNATVAVVDMNRIESLADFCKEMYSGVETRPSTSGFILYTRNGDSLYDLGDYTKAMAAQKGYTLTREEWEDALSTCVLYKASTENDFNNRPINPENFSGISTHVYTPSDTSDREMYYKSYNWYQRVF
ncbi:MAG: hypothetical protein J1F16_03460 [Muribaculaceae bacterium]|nr:hypothetical protein [Muribaculaceae bacterium]